MKLLPFLAAFILAWSVAFLAVTPAQAQNLEAAAEDLQDHDVTFEQGAVTQDDLNDLDNAAARLQQDSAYFKIVVLAEAVTDFPSLSDFAERLLNRLGGNGRILVYDKDNVAIASNVDSASEVARAEQAVLEEANRTDSFAEGALAGGEVLLGGTVAPGADSGGGGSDGEESRGGFSIFWVVVAGLAIFVGIMLLARRSSRGSKVGEATERALLGEGERKVREAVNSVANKVIELYDEVNRPDAPPAAKDAYQEGSRIFMDVQDQLEEADTRPELEQVYPRLVEADWRLDSAKDLLAGRPAPPKPTPAPLFPEPVLTQQPVPPQASAAPAPVETVPEAEGQHGYRRFQSSPWLTAAAMTAISLLLSGRTGGMMGGGWAGRSYRQPMDDDIFDGMFGGGWSGRTGRRPRINLGGGRGFGGRGFGGRGFGGRGFGGRGMGGR